MANTYIFSVSQLMEFSMCKLTIWSNLPQKDLRQLCYDKFFSYKVCFLCLPKHVSLEQTATV